MSTADQGTPRTPRPTPAPATSGPAATNPAPEPATNLAPEPAPEPAAGRLPAATAVLPPGAPSQSSGPSSRATTLGWALALGSTVAFSFAPPVARAAILGGMNSNEVLMLRMLIASTLLGLTLAFTARKSLRLPPAGIRAAVVAGAINAIGMILFFLSLNYLEASLGAMIITLSPPLVLTLLALRGERLTRRHLLRLGIALAGVYLLISPTGAVHWGGALMALVATFFFAFQMAYTQWTLTSYPVRGVVFYVTVTMTAFVVAWWLFQGAAWTAPTPLGWLQVLILAVVSTYFARLGYYAAIGHIGSGQLALLGPLETMLSVVWAVLFLHERLAPWQIAGGVLILASALLAVQRFGPLNLRLPRR